MGDAHTAACELDYLYNQIDKLYSQFARRCGVSSCAYWMLYDLARAEGKLPVRTLFGSWSYSKQTMNSALKSLEAKGLICLAYEEGSRKHKVAGLTVRGEEFATRYIRPAIAAEDRAFCALDPDERATLAKLVGKYARALDVEFAKEEVPV